jgi:hypothetical protein
MKKTNNRCTCNYEAEIFTPCDFCADEVVCQRDTRCTCDFINDEFPCSFCEESLNPSFWKSTPFGNTQEATDKLHELDAMCLSVKRLKHWTFTWQEAARLLNDGCN